MTDPELRVGPDARDTRAAVGPVAWVVLEELALNADHGRRVEIATTVRELAGAVGLSKDTVAGGLRRLSAAGLVVREDRRDQRSGCFGNSVYVLDLTGTGLRIVTPEGPEPDTGSSDTVNYGASLELANRRREAPSRRRMLEPSESARTAVGQLSFLDDEPLPQGDQAQ